VAIESSNGGIYADAIFLPKVRSCEGIIEGYRVGGRSLSKQKKKNERGIKSQNKKTGYAERGIKKQKLMTIPGKMGQTPLPSISHLFQRHMKKKLNDWLARRSQGPSSA
jgi:hypothetical protein